MNNKNPQFLVVDLFCGAGGTTIGFERSGVAKVIAAVNHDARAIESHWANHPEVKHFEEDVRTLDLKALSKHVKKERAKHPDALLILWASLECTNFSKAKGGMPREADSRTLAYSLCKRYLPDTNEYLDGNGYIQMIDPDYVMIENVVEFQSWGPLCENGKPISRKNGSDWLKWRSVVNTLGYHDDWTQMNAADFGGRTSRNRLFGCFAKNVLRNTWPTPTHAKNPQKEGMFGKLEPWKPCRPCLDLDDKGASIFKPGRIKSDKTFQRIYAGLVKYVAGMTMKEFLMKYNSMDAKTGEFRNASTENPAPTIATQRNPNLVQPEFLLNYHHSSTADSTKEPSGSLTTKDKKALVTPVCIVQHNGGNPESKTVNLDGPARTLTSTGGKQSLVLINSYYGNSDKLQSADEACGTITTKDRFAAVFLDKQYSSGTKHQSVDVPAGSITAVPKLNLVHAFLFNPSHGGHHTGIDRPSQTVIARQDKAPLYLLQTDTGELAIPVFEQDSETVRNIKQFMAMYGIVDIKMRMLKVVELKRIQGFPEDYVLKGTQTDQKKFIGNSVEPNVVAAWIKALATSVSEAQSNAA